jgi:hypothetical protein
MSKRNLADLETRFVPFGSKIFRKGPVVNQFRK